MALPPVERDEGQAHVEATISFLSTEAGGRNQGVSSGYRPNHHFGGDDGLWDAMHIYPDKIRVEPGETVRALLYFPAPERHARRFFVGFRFKVQEGGRVVGEGEVTKVGLGILQCKE